MRCLYCNKPIDRYTLKSFLLKDDSLCIDCRKELKVDRKIIKLYDLEVETFFEYEGIFKDLLLQFKECYDEALKDVFLYDLKEYLEFKYHGYNIVYVPSSLKKINERGFNHLKLIYSSLNLKKEDVLRTKQDLIQQGKNKEDRIKIIDNFYFEGKHLKKVLIVDDVLTTGSSMLGAFKALNGKCEKIKAICLAKAK